VICVRVVGSTAVALFGLVAILSLIVVLVLDGMASSVSILIPFVILDAVLDFSCAESSRTA